MFSNMKATAIVRRRMVVASDAFADIVIWRVPRRVPPSTHDFKFRLAYVVNEQCVVRYDNERGKGDHRHVDDVQSDYRFSSPEGLMADFLKDIDRWNRENGRT